MIRSYLTIEAPTGQERRAQRRFDTIVEAPLTVLAQGRELTARVANFSLGGIGVELEADLAPDTEIEIDHPVTGRLTGVCRWRRDGLTGLSFMETNQSVSLCAHYLKQMVPEAGIPTGIHSTTRFL